MPHEVDKLGFPVDPEIRQLENHLGDLAAAWRYSYKESLVKEYNQTMKRLYELGWDGILDVESELPSHLMPTGYFEHLKSRKR